MWEVILTLEGSQRRATIQSVEKKINDPNFCFFISDDQLKVTSHYISFHHLQLKPTFSQLVSALLKPLNSPWYEYLIKHCWGSSASHLASGLPCSNTTVLSICSSKLHWHWESFYGIPPRNILEIPKIALRIRVYIYIYISLSLYMVQCTKKRSYLEKIKQIFHSTGYIPWV